MLVRCMVVALALLVSGCGDDGDGGVTSPAGSETPNAAGAEDDRTDEPGSDDEALDLTGVDACSLIDNETVLSLTGESGRFASQRSGGDTSCFWGSTAPGVGAHVELELFSQPGGLSATRIDLGQPCTVTPSGAVGEEAALATCPGGAGGVPQSKVQLRAFERGVIITLLVNDAAGLVTEAELAQVAESVLSQLR
jgi:hypothetical protein